MTVTYVTMDAPSFSMRVEVNEKDVRIQFANKELHLDEEKDAALIVVLDELIATKPNISCLIKKVNIEEALRIAEIHKATRIRDRGTMKGPVTSSDADQIGRASLSRQEDRLRFEGASEEDIAKMRAEMSKDHFEITEASGDKIAPDTREGFNPDESVKETEPVSETEKTEVDPKNVFANLVHKAK